MKPLLILILSLSFSFAAFGQEYPDSGFTNKAEAKNFMVNGKKEGKWVKYIYTDDQIDGIDSLTSDTNIANYYYLTCYRDGVPYGVERKYKKYGKSWCLLEKMTLKNGICNGWDRTYYKSGKIETETQLIDLIPNGVEKEYYESGELKLERHWINGKQEGIQYWYY